MSRLLPVVPVIALVFTLAPAAPIPEAAKPVLYFPTKVGAKWTYRLSKVESATWVEEVVKVEQTRGGVVVTVRKKDAKGKTDREWSMLVSAKGVFARFDEGVGQVVLFPKLRLPARPGDRWEAGDSKRTFVFTAGQEEEVEVPAGRFRAVPVKFLEAKGKGLPMFIEWWAPGVGVVRREIHTENWPYEEVLVSFVPG